MSYLHGSESEFELTTIKRLEALGYEFGMEIKRSLENVVLEDVLRASLRLRYIDLSDDDIEEALKIISRPQGVDTLHRNLYFHQLITQGFDLQVQENDEQVKHHHIYPID